MSDSADKRIPPFGLRMPDDLKARVQDAATQSKQSMNSLIVSVLEREFPRPTINVHELAAFLAGIASEEDSEDGGKAYLEEINRVMATAKFPWTERTEEGAVRFYPYATRPRTDEDKAAIRRLVEKGLKSE